MMYKLRRVVLGSIFAFITFMLIAVHGFAQSPPTATEAFNLRIKCKKMSDKKAHEFIEANSIAK